MNIRRILFFISGLVIALGLVHYSSSTMDDVARRVYRAMDALAFQRQGLTEEHVFNLLRAAIETEGLDPNYVDKGTGLSLLMYAARTGSFVMVKYLVDKGANVQYTNALLETPLMYAALSGDLRTIKYLVEEKGADVNAASKGWSVLKWGKDFDQSKLVSDYLRSKGAVPNVYEWGPQKRQPTYFH